MPTNLNALIRYKTIDKCLSESKYGKSIKELISACSEALLEHQGIDKEVSIRTIRDDIRIMRSDILGFNAPIAVKNGYYFYEDEFYSIFKLNLKSKELLTEIYFLLLREGISIKNPKLPLILEKLSNLTENNEDRITRNECFSYEEPKRRKYATERSISQNFIKKETVSIKWEIIFDAID